MSNIITLSEARAAEARITACGCGGICGPCVRDAQVAADYRQAEGMEEGEELD